MCYHPNQAGLARYPGVDGKRKLLFGYKWAFNPLYSRYYEPIGLPCGKCIACRLKYSREWAFRCYAEAKGFDNNCFITLTLSDPVIEHVHGQSLVKDFFPRFFKRYRKRFGNGIRYFHCGEYGDKFGRPHYHAIVFNHSFDDLVLYKRERGIDLFRSMELEKLWSHPVHKFSYGYATVGSVSFDSAAYVARYCTKKVGGKLALNHYRLVTDMGNVVDRIPEFATMSRRPGIGENYYREFGKEIYVTDSVSSLDKPGLEFKPPRYYDDLYELDYPSDLARVKKARVDVARKRAKDCTPERLDVREKVHLAKAKLLVRNFETGVFE